MADNATSNGADGGERRERPSWYVPIRATEDDDRSVQEVLRETWGDDPVELPEEAAVELLAYLDQFKASPER